MYDIKGIDAANSALRWGIVLAGGNGARLRDLVYRKRADYLPKQYLNFIGKRSMLEHTLDRAEKLIPAPNILTVIAKEHLKFAEVKRQIAARAQERFIVQPENKDTGPGILLPLMHLHKRNPAAVVTIFPSDHFILEERVFMQHVEQAFRIVESDGGRMVLLGIEPNQPDPEYGYILYDRGSENQNLDGGRTVEMFVEKPPADAAKTMMRNGALWNTLVLVATCETLLQAIKRAAPGLYGSFETLRDAIGTADEQRVTERVYQTLPSVNFSKDVLEVLPYEFRRELRVLPVRGVTWSDCGTADRLSSSVRELGASAHLPPASVLREPQQVGHGSNKVSRSSVLENRRMAVKEN
jgi:mannose-1-phosphate guanylyltransferase